MFSVQYFAYNVANFTGTAMECLQDREHSKINKPSLTFSIDMIMGKRKADVENDVDVRDRSQDATDNAEQNDVPSKRRKLMEDEESVPERSFQPVRKQKDVLKDEVIRHQTLMAAQYQQAAVFLKAEMQKRQMSSYLPRDIYDVNMNAVSYLHPAFVLGRLSQEEYRAHVLQNLTALQHQLPNVHKNVDTYKFLNSKNVHQHNINYGQNSDVQRVQHNQTLKDNKTRVQERQIASPCENDVDRSFSKSEPTSPVTEPASAPSEASDVDITSPERRTGGGPVAKGAGGKSFSCPECGKLFNAHYNLTRHMPVHTGTSV